MDNGLALLPVAAGEIHDVVVTGGGAEITFTDDAMTAGFNAAGAVQEFEGSGGGGEDATAKNEGSAIEGYVLMGGSAEGGVVERERAARDFDAGIGIAFEVGVSDAGFGRADRAIDGQTAPTHAGTGRDSEADGRRSSAFGQQLAAVGDDQVNARCQIQGCAGLDDQCHTTGDR